MKAYLISYDIETSSGTERREVELYGETAREAIKTFHLARSTIRGWRLTEHTPCRAPYTQEELRAESGIRVNRKGYAIINERKAARGE